MTNDKTKDKESSLQRTRIKTDLLVHDIKSPLAVVEAGISSLLRKPDKYGPLTEKQEQVLLRTLRNTKLAQSLVNHIMELGMAREGVFRNMRCTISGLVLSVLRDIFDLTDANMAEKINFCQGLSHLKELLAGKGIVISVEQGPWCQEIYLDEVKVKQVFRNLLINAMKYRKKTVEIEFSFEGRLLKVSVKDDGKGIDIMYHKRIFESYFQIDDINKYGVRSHGLGLAGAMVLIEDMGGELLLESDEGKGTKFIAKIPLRED